MKTIRDKVQCLKTKINLIIKNQLRRIKY